MLESMRLLEKISFYKNDSLMVPIQRYGLFCLFYLLRRVFFRGLTFRFSIYQYMCIKIPIFHATWSLGSILYSTQNFKLPQKLAEI